MLIPEDILLSYGAETEDFEPSFVIFEEGSTPKYYYQIVEGRIKLNYYDREGKELILAILGKGLSVCELLLFIDEKYPVNAISFEHTRVLKLPKSNFESMLDEHPQISRDMNKFLSERLYQKYIMMENNASLRPEVRIIGALNYQKSFSDEQKQYSFEVPLTRQQIASITALRVETVIRTIKKLERDNVLKIINRKIYL